MKNVLISFLLVVFTINIYFINTLPIFGNTYLKKDKANSLLAEKYCDSLEKNLFKGLDKESTLKYEYFFSSIPQDFIKEENKFLEIFKSDVKSICSYEISKSNEKEFTSFLQNYFKTKTKTPNISVEDTNPTPINPAIIPVLR